MRYKPAGTEMMPSPGFMSRAEEPGPGTAWAYVRPEYVVALIFDDIDVLSVTSENLLDFRDADKSSAVTRNILDSSAAGLSIQQALERVQEAFGKPDIVLPLPNINDPGEAIRAAVDSHR